MIFRSRSRALSVSAISCSFQFIPNVFPYNTNDIMIYLSKLIRRFKWTAAAAKAAMAATA